MTNLITDNLIAEIVNLFNPLKNFSFRETQGFVRFIFSFCVFDLSTGKNETRPRCWDNNRMRPTWPLSELTRRKRERSERSENGRGGRRKRCNSRSWQKRGGGGWGACLCFWWLPDWSFLKCERKKVDDRVVNDLNSPCQFNIYYIFHKKYF